MSTDRQQHRLGRGLGALIPSILSEKTLQDLSLEQIDINPFQPRQAFNEDELQTLADSIKKFGVTQPILVRKNGNRYELVAGERRLRASKLAGKSSIPAVIKALSDIESVQIALVENLERSDLSVIEVAKGYERLIDEFGYTHQQVSELFSRSRSSVSNTLRLLSLPIDVQDALLNGQVSEGQVRPLLSVLDQEEVFHTIWKQIQEKNISARAVENLLKKDTMKKKAQIKSLAYHERLETIKNVINLPLSIKEKKKGGIVSISYKNAAELDRLLNKLS